ncbi:MAG: outer membrane protein assembly factor BamD [Gemmatimonadales bacterium]|nr:MAG: outer membrane protein assembly factor BamD [Gemmatimonadales bacterium]
MRSSKVRRSTGMSPVTRWLSMMAVLFVVGACASTSPWETMEAEEELWEFAMEAYEDEDWDDAIGAMEALMFRSPGFERMPELRMYLARAHFGKGEYLTAAAEFERFLQRYSNHGLAPEASLGVCRSHVRLAPNPQRDPEHTELAVTTCGQTASEFAGMNVAEEARDHRDEMTSRLAQRRLEQARFYQRRALHDSAIMYFQDLVDRFPETEQAARGYLGLYRSYREIGWDEEAERARERLLENYPDSRAARTIREEGGTGE